MKIATVFNDAIQRLHPRNEHERDIRAITEIFNIEISVISTLGREGSVMIKPEESIPLTRITIGHFAEGQGIHYVVLQRENDTEDEDELDLEQRNNTIDVEQRYDSINAEQRNNAIQSEQRNNATLTEQRNDSINAEQQKNAIQAEQQNYAMDSERNENKVNYFEKLPSEIWRK